MSEEQSVSNGFKKVVIAEQGLVLEAVNLILNPALGLGVDYLFHINNALDAKLQERLRLRMNEVLKQEFGKELTETGLMVEGQFKAAVVSLSLIPALDPRNLFIAQNREIYSRLFEKARAYVLAINDLSVATVDFQQRVLDGIGEQLIDDKEPTLLEDEYQN